MRCCCLVQLQFFFSLQCHLANSLCLDFSVSFCSFIYIYLRPSIHPFNYPSTLQPYIYTSVMLLFTYPSTDLWICQSLTSIIQLNLFFRGSVLSYIVCSFLDWKPFFFISVFAVAEEMRQQQAHLNDRRVPHRLSLFRCLLGIITLP